MKKSFLMLTLLAGLFLFTACSNDDDDDSNPGNTTESTTYIKCKVNGSVLLADVGIAKSQRFSISSVTMNNGPIVMISFPQDFTVGTHSITDFSDWDGYHASYNTGHSDTELNMMYATSGTITITEYDSDTQIVKGTFSFTVGDYSITDGEFVAELF